MQFVKQNVSLTVYDDFKGERTHKLQNQTVTKMKREEKW